MSAFIVLLCCGGNSIADETVEPAKKKPPIGRYQIVGEWRLDTATGRVEKIAKVYERQVRDAAKDIRETLKDGETLLSVGFSAGILFASNVSPTDTAIRRPARQACNDARLAKNAVQSSLSASIQVAVHTTIDYPAQQP